MSIPKLTASRKSAFPTLLLLITVLVASGCAELRKMTYPADFKYLGRSEVKGTMAVFGHGIWEMDQILSDPDRALTERERIIEILDQLEEHAQSINPSGRPTNHTVIDSNIQQFIDAVRDARDDIEGSPPSFYAAGQLSGRCMACHIHR